MAANDLVLRQGAKGPLYADVSSLTALTYNTATFTLQDRTGTAVSGFSGVPISGETTTGNVVEVFYNFDTTSLTPGYYYGFISVNVTGSDSLVRVIIQDWDIYIKARA